LTLMMARFAVSARSHRPQLWSAKSTCINILQWNWLSLYVGTIFTTFIKRSFAIWNPDTLRVVF
jgi:hypothetical protein